MSSCSEGKEGKYFALASSWSYLFIHFCFDSCTGEYFFLIMLSNQNTLESWPYWSELKMMSWKRIIPCGPKSSTFSDRYGWHDKESDLRGRQWGHLLVSLAQHRAVWCLLALSSPLGLKVEQNWLKDHSKCDLIIFPSKLVESRKYAILPATYLHVHF